MPTFRRFLLLCVLLFWQGGFTFYTAVVIPVGAHVLGFNTGSTGVSLIGDFSGGPAPAAATDAAGRLLAWKLSLTGVDPMGVNNYQSQDSSSGAKYPAGTVVTLNNISGHQDANFTDCPGQVEGQLPQIRSTAKGWSGAFLAFPSGFRGGAYVAAADFTGDWISEHYHRQIAAALAAHDAERAELVMKEHVFEARDVLVAHVRELEASE